MKKIINQILNILVSVAMIFFAIPKLLGKPQSMEGFKQFEAAIHLDAHFFMIFTGVSELALAALVIYFAFSSNKIIGQLAYTFLLVTMVSALGLEFFARPSPKFVLVIIAVILIAISLFKLKTMNPIKTEVR